MAYARRRSSSARYPSRGRTTRTAGRTTGRRIASRGRTARTGGATKLVIEIAGMSGVSRSITPQVAGALPKRAKY